MGAATLSPSFLPQLNSDQYEKKCYPPQFQHAASIATIPESIRAHLMPQTAPASCRQHDRVGAPLPNFEPRFLHAPSLVHKMDEYFRILLLTRIPTMPLPCFGDHFCTVVHTPESRPLFPLIAGPPRHCWDWHGSSWHSPK